MGALIQFFPEEVDFKLNNEQKIHNWLEALIEEEDREAGVINIIFCNDQYLLDLNQRFLDRNTLTDVIAFDYHEGETDVSGDIFISVDRISENAGMFDQSIDNEMHRVIAHGLLHLCGYADKTEEEKAFMTLKEDKYLSLLTL